MREDSLEEFEAVFEHASIPVLDVKKVTFERILVVLQGTALDRSAARLATYLAGRFGGTATALYREESAWAAVESGGLTPGMARVEGPFQSTPELLGQISMARPDLVLFPVNAGDDGGVMDEIIRFADPPVLLIRDEVAEPERVFGRILHSLTGNFQQSENFNCPFSLVKPSGEILLLHAIEQSEIEDVNEALLSTSITSSEGAKLLDALSHHGERFLKGVVLSMREEPVGVSYRIVVGSVEEQVNRASRRILPDRGRLG